MSQRFFIFAITPHTYIDAFFNGFKELSSSNEIMKKKKKFTNPVLNKTQDKNTDILVHKSQEVQMQEHVDSLHSSNKPHNDYEKPVSNSNRSNKDFDDPADWNRDYLDLINHFLSNPSKIIIRKIDFSSSKYRDSGGKLRRAHSDLFFRTENKEGRKVLRDKNSKVHNTCFSFPKKPEACIVYLAIFLGNQRAPYVKKMDSGTGNIPKPPLVNMSRP